MTSGTKGLARERDEEAEQPRRPVDSPADIIRRFGNLRSTLKPTRSLSKLYHKILLIQFANSSTNSTRPCLFPFASTLPIFPRIKSHHQCLASLVRSKLLAIAEFPTSEILLLVSKRPPNSFKTNQLYLGIGPVVVFLAALIRRFDGWSRRVRLFERTITFRN
jgi:hypothetical protein